MGTVIVNTTSSAEELRDALQLDAGTVGILDALGIAVEEKTRVNTALLGAVVRVCPFLEPDAVKETIRATFGRRHPEVVEANIRTFDRGYDELQLTTFEATGPVIARPPARQQPSFGYLEAPIGGVILEAANSVVKDLSTSRVGFVPELLLEKCVHCGLCDIVCPDLCMVWDEKADGVRLPRNRLPVLQGVPQVHRGLPDRRARGDPRGRGLGRRPPRTALSGAAPPPRHGRR